MPPLCDKVRLKTVEGVRPLERRLLKFAGHGACVAAHIDALRGTEADKSIEAALVALDLIGPRLT